MLLFRYRSENVKKEKKNDGRKKRKLIIVNNKATYVYIRIGIREDAS